MQINKKYLQLGLLVVVSLGVLGMMNKYKIISFMSKVGFSYSPCINKTCVILNEKWNVVYNDKSVLGKLVFSVSGSEKKSLYMVSDSVDKKLMHVNIISYKNLGYEFLTKDKISEIKKFSWGEVILLNDDLFTEKGEYRFVIDEFKLFISTTYENFPDEIIKIYNINE